jgi:hypothetical protein
MSMTSPGTRWIDINTINVNNKIVGIADIILPKIYDSVNLSTPKKDALGQKPKAF